MRIFTLLIILSLIAGYSGAQNPVFDWEKDTLSLGNTLQKMTINGDHATIAGFNNTFLTSNDVGETWNAINLVKPSYDLMDISIKNSVGYIITAREKLYDAAQDVYTNGVIFKTTDNAQTWVTLEPVFDTVNDPAVNPLADLCFGLDFQAVETVNDTTAYCAARWYEYIPGGKESHSAVFKTIDGGFSWQNISGDLGGSSVSCIAFNGENGFIGGSNILLKTTVSADTVVDIFSEFPGSGSVYFYDIENVSETEIFITTTADSVFVTTDLGNSYNAFKGIDGASDIFKVNDSTIVVTDSRDFYVSTNYGLSWGKHTFTQVPWEIGGVANDSLILLAESAIYKSAVHDLLSGNYTFVTQNLGNDKLYKTVFEGNNLTIVGKEQNFYRSTDGGVTWDSKQLPEVPALEEVYQNIDFYGLSGVGDEAYACINRHKLMDYPSSSGKEDVYWSGGLFYTNNNWQTYNSVDIAKLGDANETDPSANPYHDSCNGVNTSVVHYIGDETVLLWVLWNDYSNGNMVEHSRVFKSIDAGKNWIPITDDLGYKNVQDIQSRGDSVYIVGEEVLLFSEDAGQKSLDPAPVFTDLYPNLDSNEDDEMYITDIELGNSNEFFVTTTRDSCFMTSDNGATFQTIGNLKGAFDFYKFDNNSYIIMGVSGSIFTNDGGANWLDCDPGEMIYEIGGVYNNRLYALARSYAISNNINNFDLKTAIPQLYSKAELKVAYDSYAVKLISSEYDIEACSVYSINGTLVKKSMPNNRIFKLNNNEFTPGVYIIHSVVKGKPYVNKVILR